MARTCNAVDINAPFGLVWDRTNDVERWPRLFTEYAAVQILERRGDTVRFRLTMHPDEAGRVWTWVSERTADARTRVVKAHRIETGPFEYMNIEWRYEEIEGGIRMHWMQDFRMEAGAPLGDEQMVERINRNTREQMAIIKARIEALAAVRR